MKHFNIISLAISVIIFYACKVTQSVTSNKQLENVQLITQLKGCKDSLMLYEFNGIGLNKVKGFEQMPGDHTLIPINTRSITHRIKQHARIETWLYSMISQHDSGRTSAACHSYKVEKYSEE